MHPRIATLTWCQIGSQWKVMFQSLEFSCMVEISCPLARLPMSEFDALWCATCIATAKCQQCSTQLANAQDRYCRTCMNHLNRHSPTSPLTLDVSNERIKEPSNLDCVGLQLENNRAAGGTPSPLEKPRTWYSRIGVSERTGSPTAVVHPQPTRVPKRCNRFWNIQTGGINKAVLHIDVEPELITAFRIQVFALIRYSTVIHVLSLQQIVQSVCRV